MLAKQSNKRNNMLERPPIPKLVQNYIREYIINENLSPGDALPVHGRIAQELGVSVASVREAVRVLESLGIIEVRHGDGLYVRAVNLDGVLDVLSFTVMFDPNALVELLQLRRWFESSLMPEVVRLIQPEDISNCKKILTDWEHIIESGLNLIEQDRAFHQALYRPIRNHLMSRLADVFFLPCRHGIEKLDLSKAYITTKLKNVEDHRAILAAVEEKDERLSRRLMYDHFEEVKRTLEKQMHRKNKI